MFIPGKETLPRWLKFNTVGALGFAVQLLMLAALLRFFPNHFVWASVLAVETAVLHNFFWHWRWTWSDRGTGGLTGMASRLLRFNLSNGLISLFGTALCTGILTGYAHLNPFLANALSLIPCCAINYLVSDRLVFLNLKNGRVLMKRRVAGGRSVLFAFLLCLVMPLVAAAAILQMRTLQSWNAYTQLTEKRIAGELKAGSEFLVMDFMKQANAAKVQSALTSGKVHAERMKTLDANGREIDVPGGLIHHWYGAIFIPGMKVEPLLRWIQDYDQQYKYFKEVEQSKLVSHDGDTYRIFIRLTRTKVVTVHYNTDHTVIYQNNGPGRASSRSFTTKIAEIDNADTPSEKESPVGNDSGYLWRLNSYWRFREQAGGVVVECESLSLSRGIPFGLEWLIGNYIESIPRESLESALMSIRDGVKTAR